MRTEQQQQGRYLMVYWAVLAASFILCYLPALQWLHFKFLTPSSYYSHGYLIPMVSAYLIFERRKELAALEPRPWPPGLLAVLLALLLHIIATLGDINFISGFSMVLYITGCVLYLLGRTIARAIIFPLAFMLFMCPIPEELMGRVALPMKSAATSVTMVLLKLINIPCERSGFTLELPDAVFLVGAPCNGMRSLISFLALGSLMAYLLRGAWWKRALLMSAIPPLAIGLNGMRMAVLLTISHHYGREAASPESFLHDASGMTVFLVGLALLMGVTWKLR